MVRGYFGFWILWNIRRFGPVLGGVFLVVFFVSGCAPVEVMPGPRTDARCVLLVAFRPEVELARKDLSLTREQVERPELVGSWNAYQRPGYQRFEETFSASGVRYFLLSLPLPPGRYRYGFLVGNELLQDALNPHTEFAPHPVWKDSTPYEAEWSVQEFPDCRLPTLSVPDLRVEPASDRTQNDGTLTVRFRLEEGTEAATLDFPSVKIEQNGHPAPFLSPSVSLLSEHEIEVVLSHVPSGKYAVELSAQDTQHALPLVKTVQAVVAPRNGGMLGQPTGEREDIVLYHIFLDRFRGNKGPLLPPKTPGHRAGGTLNGVLAAVENGYFEAMGITTLWLSPLYENPPGIFRGRDGNEYEAYHGYWPSEPRSVEPSLGTETELEKLVETAHRHGLRVIFDAVPNHVHNEHPYYKEHSRRSPATFPEPDKKSWFSDGNRSCVCGTPGCGWGERIEDCWFDSYLPDVNLRNPEAAAQQRTDLLYWLKRFDLDGMRIDAVPMMPRGFTRSVVKAVSEQATRKGLDVLLIGEDYTGPGDGGRFEIRSFLGDRFFGLQSAFDFPLFWATVDALAKDRIPMTTLEKQIALSQDVYGGSGAVMGHMLNNHDTARFVSEAAGNAGNPPWTDPPAQPAELEPYKRHQIALTLLFTLPGIPVLYYGDEIGLAGAGDPDSRRVLPDVLSEPTLPSFQRAVLAHAKRLGVLRTCLPVLRKGQRKVLDSSTEHTVALHTPKEGQESETEVALSVLSRNTGERLLQVTGVPIGTYKDVLTGERLSVEAGTPARIVLRSLQSQLFVKENSLCLPRGM